MVDLAWREKALKIGGLIAAGAVIFFAGKATSGSTEDSLPIGIQPVASVPQTAAAPELKVHIVGLVAKPGLYTMPGGSRIQDAIDLAGGPLKDADLESVNLAQKLNDGDQLRIGPKGNEPVQIDGLPPGPLALSGPVSSGIRSGGGTTSAPTSTGAPRSSSSAKAAKPAARSISLNSASASELDRLPGVGPATAAKIIEYRSQHGGFSSIDELLAVRGIGPKKLADIKPFVRL